MTDFSSTAASSAAVCCGVFLDVDGWSGVSLGYSTILASARQYAFAVYGFGDTSTLLFSSAARGLLLVLSVLDFTVLAVHGLPGNESTTCCF